MQRNGNKNRCSKIHGMRFVRQIRDNLIFREGNGSEQTLIFTWNCRILITRRERKLYNCIEKEENSIAEMNGAIVKFFKRTINRPLSGITFTSLRVLSYFIRDREKLPLKHPLLVYPNSSSLI